MHQHFAHFTNQTIEQGISLNTARYNLTFLKSTTENQTKAKTIAKTKPKPKWKWIQMLKMNVSWTDIKRPRPIEVKTHFNKGRLLSHEMPKIHTIHIRICTLQIGLRVLNHSRWPLSVHCGRMVGQFSSKWVTCELRLMFDHFHFFSVASYFGVCFDLISEDTLNGFSIWRFYLSSLNEPH